ncbi:MAG: hypothetical protein KDK45_05140, partial [Leptospiraceae bacterium]|nr:hypothetical protein [Leptospiraceae bacterium]
MYRQDFKSLIIFISLWLFPTFSPKAEEILKTKETVEISSPEKPSNKENEPEEDPEKVKMNLEIRQMANEAYRALRFRNLKEATSLLKDIGRLNKKSVDYYYIEGAIYYSKNKFHQSILSLESAIKINPSHDRSQFLLGMNYIHLHIWKEAIPYFQQAVQSDPYDPFYRLNLSLANYFTQRFNDSALEAKKAVDLKNNYSDAKL